MSPGKRLFVTKTLVEFVDLACRVKNLLFAGVERVALRADVDSHIVSAVGRAGSEGIATATFYVYIGVFWVDISFHVVSLVRIARNLK
jgi:hypothetical protein